MNIISYSTSLWILEPDEEGGQNIAPKWADEWLDGEDVINYRLKQFVEVFSELYEYYNYCECEFCNRIYLKGIYKKWIWILTAWLQLQMLKKKLT